MKLNLNNKDGVLVLSVEGSLSASNMKVLRAGITKLFKNGKNKIVLDLSPVQKMDAQTPQALFDLKNLASELKGEIALAITNADILKFMRQKSGADTLWCYDAIGSAVTAFSNKGEESPAEPSKEKGETSTTEIEALSKIELPEGTADDIIIALKEREDLIQALREKLAEYEKNSLHELRAENEELKEKNLMLTEKLIAELKDEREPQDMSGFQAKIATLEKKLSSTLDRLMSLEKER